MVKRGFVEVVNADNDTEILDTIRMGNVHGISSVLAHVRPANEIVRAGCNGTQVLFVLGRLLRKVINTRPINNVGKQIGDGLWCMLAKATALRVLSTDEAFEHYHNDLQKLRVYIERGYLHQFLNTSTRSDARPPRRRTEAAMTTAPPTRSPSPPSSSTAPATS